MRLLSLPLLALLAGGVSAAHPLVLPETPRWSVQVPLEPDTAPIRLPDERARIALLPDGERESVLLQVQRQEKNQALVRMVGQAFFEGEHAGEPWLIPDYDRRMRDVAVSISTADESAPNPLWRHLHLLQALPGYARLHLFLPPAAKAAASKALAKAGLLRRAVFHEVRPSEPAAAPAGQDWKTTRWIRDTFMVGADSQGRGTAFVPLAYASVDNLEHSDLGYLREPWNRHDRRVDIPAFIRGGNVAVADNLSGQRIGFIGSDEIVQNETRYVRATGLVPPRELTIEVVRRMSGASRVVVLPNTQQLFHVDMAISFVAPGVAAVLAPVDGAALPPQEAHALAHYRQVLESEGFAVVAIPTTAQRIATYRSTVNNLPFLDGRTGRRSVIVPRFPDERVTVEGKAVSLNAAVRDAYRRAGLSVTWALDHFSEELGSIHCAALPLN